MAGSSEVSRAVLALANAYRYDPTGTEEIFTKRTDLEEAKVRAWVAKTLAAAPPHLTPETTAQLVRLLSAGKKGDGK